MATTSAEPLFVDTNILVYSTNLASPWHMPSRAALEQALEEGRLLTASTQVLREYLAVATRPGNGPVAGVLSAVETFRRSFLIIDDSQAVFTTLCTLIRSVPVSGKQIHDANIVATMLHAGIRELLTHNVSDFARFAHLVTVVPLVAPTAS